MSATQTLKGQIAIITGASQGIGQAVARRLAELGLHLVLCARSAEKLKDLSAELCEKYPELTVLTLPCDVQDPGQVQRVVDGALAHFGHIDILINNAGVAPRTGLLQELSVADIDRTIDTNLKGAIYFMRAVLPSMVQAQGGTILNINSIAGKTAFPYWGVYDASKFGLHAITQAVGEEQRGNNIRVTGIYPGPVNTPIWDGLQLAHEPGHEGMLTVEDVADAVVYVLQQPQRVFLTDLTLAPLRPVL